MRDKRGFTLLEVIIVVGMIGIMAAIAIPTVMSWVPNYKLKAAARDVYSTLQKARSMAVKNNGNCAVTFDTSNNEYILCDEWDAAATPPCVGNEQTTAFASMGYGIGFGHGNATKQANSSGTVFPLTPDDDVSFDSNSYSFDRRGLGDVPSGYVYLDNNNSTTYAIGALSSGAIRILKWNGSDWE